MMKREFFLIGLVVLFSGCYMATGNRTMDKTLAFDLVKKAIMLSDTVYFDLYTGNYRILKNPALPTLERENLIRVNRGRVIGGAPYVSVVGLGLKDVVSTSPTDSTEKRLRLANKVLSITGITQDEENGFPAASVGYRIEYKDISRLALFQSEDFLAATGTARFQYKNGKWVRIHISR
ncbi:hypothetical protein DBR11_20880 [Pedobacter sp. HMWF019]|uniref:hypothetical protein n=1 Tax=Pedobacter sp. HMWF019 TaxID=2056856 RepID=UPI000D33BF4D|nr:hypothetical protein [Pedobacter sp. HMWF019]PTS95636.1 hypothetical protein DBR11_20880 [Pedobacter sp. HMWF019]